MREAHQELVANVWEHHRVLIVPHHMKRDPWTQARLWRGSRTHHEITQRVARMRAVGASWLAGVLEGVGPQNGPWVTNAVPGYSWHQWGEGVDYYVPKPDGSPEWDGQARGYLVLGEEAARLGLTAGVFWPRRDAGHVQFRRGSIRLRHGPEEVDRVMRSMYA